MSNDFKEFCSYIQPILNSCSGFIKTDGYMTHFPGVIVTMDADQTFYGIIHIPVIYNLYFTCIISDIMAMKKPENQIFENLYFSGNNIKGNTLLRAFELFDNIDSKVRCIYYEPDCYNINGFTTVSAVSSIGSVNVFTASDRYRIPASKAITPLSKGDTASLRIYDYVVNPIDPGVKTIRYSMFKKKFKLAVDVYSNILTI